MRANSTSTSSRPASSSSAWADSRHSIRFFRTASQPDSAQRTPGRYVNAPPTNPVTARKTAALWAENPVPDGLLVELEHFGDLGDRQELVHGNRFCPCKHSADQTAQRALAPRWPSPRLRYLARVPQPMLSASARRWPDGGRWVMQPGADGEVRAWSGEPQPVSTATAQLSGSASARAAAQLPYSSLTVLADGHSPPSSRSSASGPRLLA
jgi:hypothetical protein